MWKDLGPCIPWVGSYHSNGYGRVWIKTPKGPRRGYHQVATRYVWEKANGPIPPGLVVRHKCDNPACVSLLHLVLGTQTENMRDASQRGRCRGTLEPTISDETMSAAKRLKATGLTNKRIAEMLGISAPSVSRICNGKQRSPHSGRQQHGLTDPVNP